MSHGRDKEICGMVDRVACPGCAAQLDMPVLPMGQTVQCPKCLRVFESFKQRVGAAPKPAPASPRHDDEPEFELPDPSPPLNRSAPLRGERLSVIAMWLLAVTILSFGLDVCVYFERLQLIEMEREAQPQGLVLILGPARGDVPQRVDPQIKEFERRSSIHQRVSFVATIGHHLIWWPTILVFLLWLHRAYDNLPRLQAVGLSDVPFLAAISFFAPILNLFRPYVIMQEIWRASDPEAINTPQSLRKNSPLIVLWWGLFLPGMLLLSLRNLVVLEGIQNPDDQEIACWLAIVGCSCMIGAGICLIFVLRAVMPRQRERFARLYGDSE